MPRSVFTQEYERFRRLLIDARKRSGLSQSALAEKLSRPQSFVSKYERGERRLDVIETGLVARALGVDPIEFLRRVYKSKDGGST
ncbi:MAG TPA: helix-turn-helix transcriptional regulator [Bryobacterales bacterium]|nr:helix-turn-helix transcriptional regulator [Bryobacterales bacterium]